MGEHVQALRVSRHQPVLDAVVDHLDEMACAGRAAVQVAERGRRGARGPAGGGTRGGLAPGCGRHPASGRERRQRRLEECDRVRLPADHQAEPLLEPEHPAARADVEVADSGGLELIGATDVVPIVRVAAVDEHIALGEQRPQLADHRVDDRRRHHDPHGPRRRKHTRQLRQRVRPLRALRSQRRHGRGLAVVGHALVTALHQAPHHVGAHAPEPDHPDPHRLSPRAHAAGKSHAFCRRQRS